MTTKSKKQKKSRQQKAEEEGAQEAAAQPDVKHEKADEAIENQDAAEVAAGKKPVQDEVALLTDRLLRLQADFENFRKRTARERTDLYKRANEELLEALLPAIDHMDLALQAAQQPGDEKNPFVEGFQMIQNQLCDTLSRFGLQEIKSDGVAFDPNVHEAIAHIPSDQVAENHVVEQTRRGFIVAGRVLRAAQVVVSSGAVDSRDESATEEAEKEA